MPAPRTADDALPHWTIRQTDAAAFRADVPYLSRFDWSWSMLAISDVHLDNPHCDRRLLKRHLDEAKARGAAIVIIGDLFCLMQGKYDPRSSKQDMRPEYLQAGRPYLDAVLEDAVAFLAPYADQLMLVSEGNHETNIAARLETDMIARFCDTMRDRHGSPVLAGPYAGWLRLAFRCGNAARFRNVHFDHGSGGGGPVTKGIIQVNRRQTYLDDCDVDLTGHIHERWMLQNVNEYVDKVGRIRLRPTMHLCLGTYKEERLAGRGYHVERSRPPKPLGGWWIDARLSMDDRTKDIHLSARPTEWGGR